MDGCQIVVDVILMYTRAFLITDVMSKQGDIVTSVSFRSRTYSSKSYLICGLLQGATAVSVLLHNTGTGRKLYVANVGDSRAVLCCQKDLDGYVSIARALVFN